VYINSQKIHPTHKQGTSNLYRRKPPHTHSVYSQQKNKQNNMKKTIIIALISLLTTTTIVAQNNDTTIIERNINIEKEYIPEIEPAESQKFNIKTQEPNIPEAKINYSTYASGIQPKSNFYPLDPQAQTKSKTKNLKKQYKKVKLLTVKRKKSRRSEKQ
jgi:hypothetical protein